MLIGALSHQNCLTVIRNLPSNQWFVILQFTSLQSLFKLLLKISTKINKNKLGLLNTERNKEKKDLKKEITLKKQRSRIDAEISAPKPPVTGASWLICRVPKKLITDTSQLYQEEFFVKFLSLQEVVRFSWQRPLLFPYPMVLSSSGLSVHKKFLPGKTSRLK